MAWKKSPEPSRTPTNTKLIAANTSPTSSNNARASCPNRAHCISPVRPICSSWNCPNPICPFMIPSPPRKLLLPMNNEERRLAEDLAQLRLCFIQENYQALADQAAREQWTHQQYLGRLLEG